MDQTQKLLQMIVENGRMGESACDQLIGRTDDAELRKELMLVKQQYADAARDAEVRLTDLGARPRPKGPAARAGMWMGVQMNTLTDVSPGRIAEIVIQGATMGVIDTLRNRSALCDASPESRELAAAFAAMQQEIIDRMKAFL